MARKKPSRVRNSNAPSPAPGYLPTPHGSIPWHFRHEGINGNGFNGVIRHMWREPLTYMAMPGKGFVQNAP